MRKTRRPSKDDFLLDHYPVEELQALANLEGYDLGVTGGDEVLEPDEDGHCICAGASFDEATDCDVQVLIRPGISVKTAQMLLLKIADEVEKRRYLIGEQEEVVCPEWMLGLRAWNKLFPRQESKSDD